MNNINKDLKDVAKLLTKVTNVVITTHINPDGDAIGSELGIYFAAQQLNINVRIINYSETPENLKFLEGTEFIEVYNSSKHDDIIANAEVIMILDLNDCSRIKTMELPIISSKAKKIVIDHHIDPKQFADYYAVDSEACSTGILIYNLIKEFKNVKLNSQIANALYTAISTDTGYFRFPRTDGNVHRVIAELIDNGANPVQVYDKIYNIMSYHKMRLWGVAFSNIKLYNNNIVAISYVDKNDFINCQAIDDDTENIVETMLSIEGVSIAAFLSELEGKNEIRISFRSKGNYSIREVAFSLGGGGHIYAAGARIKDVSLDVAIETVRNKITEIFKDKNKDI